MSKSSDCFVVTQTGFVVTQVIISQRETIVVSQLSNENEDPIHPIILKRKKLAFILEQTLGDAHELSTVSS